LNCEWLFYNFDQTASNCPGTGCPWITDADALNHIKHMAEVIQELDADILVLEEVENCDVLKMLYDYVGDTSYRYYLVKGTDTATSQNVALFTRIDPSVDLKRTEERIDFPVPGSKCGYKSTGDSAVSKHFYTRFDKITGLDKPLLLIGAHLVAFPLQADRCAQREAQATVLKDLAQKEGRDKGYHLVITGDLNDYDNSFLDAAGDVPISKALQLMKSNSSDNIVMLNAVSLLPQALRWSSWYDQNSDCKITPKEETLIDHVLLSSGLSSKISSVFIGHSFYSPMCPSFYSDHWPIRVQIDL